MSTFPPQGTLCSPARIAFAKMIIEGLRTNVDRSVVEEGNNHYLGYYMMDYRPIVTRFHANIRPRDSHARTLLGISYMHDQEDPSFDNWSTSDG